MALTGVFLSLSTELGRNSRRQLKLGAVIPGKGTLAPPTGPATTAKTVISLTDQTRFLAIQASAKSRTDAPAAGLRFDGAQLSLPSRASLIFGHARCRYSSICGSRYRRKYPEGQMRRKRSTGANRKRVKSRQHSHYRLPHPHLATKPCRFDVITAQGNQRSGFLPMDPRSNSPASESRIPWIWQHRSKATLLPTAI